MNAAPVVASGPLVPIEHEVIPDEDEIPFDFEPAGVAAAVLAEAAEAAVAELPTEVVPPPAAEPVPEQTPEPEPEPVAKVPEQEAYVPVPNLDHMRIKHVIAITSPKQFKALFASFEDQIETVIEPLGVLLNKVIMTRDVTSLEQHAAETDSYRGRVSRFLSLAVAFVEHGKSSHFMLHKSKGIAEFDREAHRRSMTSGYIGLQVRLEGLLQDIDNRVNNCKKFRDQEAAGFKNFGGAVGGRPQ
jgi:hypothetical protein